MNEHEKESGIENRGARSEKDSSPNEGVESDPSDWRLSRGRQLQNRLRFSALGSQPDDASILLDSHSSLLASSLP